MNTLIHISHAFLDLWLDAAVWLLLGLVVAGLLRTFVNSDKIGRHLKGQGFLPVIKAALLGIPLPLCSCGVIPAAVGLRRAGASKGATTAFLISTPETGVDSIAISYALLGPLMAIIRPAAAICSAIVAAALVLLGEKSQPPSPLAAIHSCAIRSSTIRSRTIRSLTTRSLTTDEQKDTESYTKSTSSCHCCTPQYKQQSAPPSLFSRIWQGQVYSFTELLGDLSLWLVVGLLASACVVALIPSDTLAEISQGGWAMIVMALIGVPMYICASASTPLAAGLMLAGVSPGAALVFLLAGPATNIATLGIVRQEMGWRTLIGYLTGVIGVAIGFGYLTNMLVDIWQINISGELNHQNLMMPVCVVWTAGIVLAAMVLNDLTRRIYNKYQRAGRCLASV